MQIAFYRVSKDCFESTKGRLYDISEVEWLEESADPVFTLQDMKELLEMATKNAYVDFYDENNNHIKANHLPAISFHSINNEDFLILSLYSTNL